MPNPMLLVLSGLPASGKSTIGRYLSVKFSIPLFSKDSFKELAFDCLGTADREWSKKIGGFSYELLFFTCKEMMKVKQSLIVESNFTSKSARELVSLVDKFGYSIVQVHCIADGDVLFSRFKNRATSGVRHPGHCDAENLNEFEPILKNSHQTALQIPGTTITVCTNDWKTIDLDKLGEQISTFL